MVNRYPARAQEAKQLDEDQPNRLPQIQDFTHPDLVSEMTRLEFYGNLDRVEEDKRVKVDFRLKTRKEHLKELMETDQEFDLLIVGSGASGAGVAIEAVSRGLKCAVIDKYDLASGTSSRSTKLAHGGIRYFEQMMMLQGDPVESYNLLYEALNERNYFLQAAPYQNKPIKLLIPEKSMFWTLFWYYPAVVLYHLLYVKSSFSSNATERIPGPKFLWKSKVKQMFPNAD